jgi:AraC-like DNA-binding protein
MMSRLAEHSTSAQVALVATLGLLPFLGEIGADADRVMGPAGLDVGRLSPASEGRMKLSAYVDIMERAAEVSRCENFGLRYGRQFPATSHGLVGDIALAAPTIGMALHQFVALFPLHQEASAVALREEGGLLWLEYRILDWRIFERRQDAELTIAMFQNLLRHALGEHFRPEEVHFEHPNPGQHAEHEACFDAPVYFSQRTNAIAFRPRHLNQPMPGADSARFSRLLAGASLCRRPRDTVPLAELVRGEIRARLPDGYPPIEDVADALGVARWTLQRRLGESGLSYSDAVCQVRQTLALNYLLLPHLSISAIGQLLGYAELSPFSRACRRWFGAPPEQIRLRQRQGA